MGVEPVTSIIGLCMLTGGALALYIENCERQKRQEEHNRRVLRKAEQKEKDAIRKRKEREKRDAIERREQARRDEIERKEQVRRKQARREEKERREEIRREQARRYNRAWGVIGEEAEDQRRMWNSSFLYDSFERYEYYRSYSPEKYYMPSFSSEFDSNFSSVFFESDAEENRRCTCKFCRAKQASPKAENRCDCFRCFLLFHYKGSEDLSITTPKATQDRNQNEKNQGSSEQSTSSINKDATTSANSSKQNKNAESKDKKQPERNNSSNNNKPPERNNNNNNNNDKNSNKNNDTIQDYGNLNDFIKALKAVLNRCNVSEELRNKVLSFFNKFEKHEENFLRLLKDFRSQNIAIEDILTIVIGLFKSDYFAQYITYPNFLALMEFIAKYIKDELIAEMVEDSLRGSKKPFETQRDECMKKVLQRDSILSEITALFDRIRREIVEDNTSRPLEPDFSGIFTKVYHYFKHNVVRGKEWSVKEYFDWVRKLLISLKNLTPEYEELMNVNHQRRVIVFDTYSTVYQGYFRIVVGAYGPTVYICTFYFREKRNKKAKDGDMYVDEKKKT